MKIGTLTLDNPFIAAPLAGVTDSAYRSILSEMGAALTCTEMVSGKGLLYENRKTEELLLIRPEEGPVSYQIFGGEPNVMRETAARLCGRENALFDINMGCPVPKVVKNGEGSALLKDLDRLYDVAHAVCEAADKPVTIKIRKGWDADHIVAAEAAKAAEAAGCAAITIHGRTREQYYTGKADWDIIAQVKKAVSIPVIGNGDVFAAADAVRMMDETGCDGVMIARGMLGNPWIFREAVSLWRDGEELPAPPAEEKRRIMLLHFARMMEDKGEKRAVLEMRKHFGWYTKGRPGSTALRRKVNTVTTADELRVLIENVE